MRKKISDLLAIFSVESQTLKTINSLAPLSSYVDLKRHCEAQAQQKALELLNACKSCPDEPGPLKAVFTEALAEYDSYVRDTSLSFGSSIDFSANHLFVEIFTILYPDASTVDFTRCFFPHINYVLFPEIMLASSTDYNPMHPIVRKKDSSIRFVKEAITVDNLNEKILMHEDFFLSVSALFQRGIHVKMVLQYCKVLQCHYPLLYQKLRSRNTFLNSFYKNVEQLQNNSCTVKEALEELKNALLRNGGRVTGNNGELSLRAARAVNHARETLLTYLARFSEQRVRIGILAMTDAALGTSLRSFLKNLATNPHQCVELAAERLMEIMQYSGNQRHLAYRPALTDAQKKELEQAIQQQLKEEFSFVADANVATLPLPAVFLLYVITRIKIQTLESSIELLNNFDEVAYRLLLEGNPDFKNILREPQAIETLFIYLRPGQKFIFAQALLEAGYFDRVIFSSVSAEECARLLEIHQTQLPRWMRNSALDLGIFLECLTDAQRGMVLKILFPVLPRMVSEIELLLVILKHLNETQCREVIEVCSEVFKKIYYPFQLRKIIGCLNLSQIRVVLEFFEKNFKIIKSALNLVMLIVEPLEEAKARLVLEIYSKQLIECLEQADFDASLTFFRVLPEGILEQKFLLRLVQFTQNTKDLVSILAYVPLKQEKIIAAFQIHLKTIIQNGRDLSDILVALPSHLHEPVLKTCEQHLSEFFKSSYGCYYFLKSLDTSCVSEVGRFFVEYFFNCIKTPADLAHILCFFQQDEDLLSRIVLKICSLGQVICNTGDIREVITLLEKNTEQQKQGRKLVIDICCRELSSGLLKTPGDLKNAVNFFHETGSFGILEMCYPKIPEFIGKTSFHVALKFAEKTSPLSVQEHCFTCLLGYVNEDYYALSCKLLNLNAKRYTAEMKTRITEVACTSLLHCIQEADLQCLLAILNCFRVVDEITNQIQEKCFVRLFESIKTRADLLKVMGDLTEAGLKAFQKQIPLYIKEKESFRQICKNSQYHDAIHFSISQYIKDFTTIYEMLYKNQHSFFKTHHFVWSGLSLHRALSGQVQLWAYLEDIHDYGSENPESRTAVALKILEDIYRGNLDKSALLKKALCVCHGVSDAGTFVSLKRGEETSRFWKLASLERALADGEATVDISLGRAEEIQKSVNQLFYFGAM